MNNPTAAQLAAAMSYAKGNRNREDIMDLYSADAYHPSHLGDKACAILAGVIDRLRARATRLEQDNLKLRKQLAALQNKQP